MTDRTKLAADIGGLLSHYQDNPDADENGPLPDILDVAEAYAKEAVAEALAGQLHVELHVTGTSIDQVLTMLRNAIRANAGGLT